MTQRSSDNNSDAAAGNLEISESKAASRIQSARSPAPPSVGSAAFVIGTVALIGVLFIAAYLVNSIRTSHLFESLVAPGAVLVGVLVGLTAAYLWWRISAQRANQVGSDLARELDLAAEMHVVAAKAQSTACRLRDEPAQEILVKEHAKEIEGLAQQIALLARYVDMKVTGSSGMALSVRRDAQLEQDMIIREFRESYAQLHAKKASEREVGEAIMALSSRLREASGDMPVPPLEAIIAPVDAGCYWRT